MKNLLRLLLWLLAGLVGTADASAQSLGLFRWQLQPSCNVLQLNVFQQGSAFILEGFDDQCGTAPRTAVVGSAFANPDGTITLGLTTALGPGGAPVRIDATVHIASLNGPWRDSLGHQGGFVFTPVEPIAGSRRGGESNGIAAGSIVFEQLGPSVVEALPPPDRFRFDESGSFFVADVDEGQGGGVLGWEAQTGAFFSAYYPPGELPSGGGLGGFASWAGGVAPSVGGDYSFAFGILTRVEGDASVAFGDRTFAQGDHSFAMGSKAGACRDGSVALGTLASTAGAPGFTDETGSLCGGDPYGHAFVFSDGTAPTFPSPEVFPAGGNNTFLVRATGGVKFFATTTNTVGCGMTAGGTSWACTSDRNTKHAFAPLDGEDVLRKLVALPVDTWSFIAEPNIRHAGPVAQDFRAAFGLGSDDTSIGYTDINGINMRAIQALEARTRELAELKARVAALEALVARLAQGAR